MSIITENLNHIKQVPQLKQVQYDTASQFYYLDKALKSLGYESSLEQFELFSPDAQIESLLPTLTSAPCVNSPEIPETAQKYFPYYLANRLGLYDAADALRWW